MGVWQKMKEIVGKMLPKKNLEEVLQIKPCVSDRMTDSIRLWADMYEGHSPWVKEPTLDDPTRVVSLGLPSLIASEKARMVTLEMKSEISAPVDDMKLENNIQPNVGNNSVVKSSPSKSDNSTNDRAEFLNKQYKKLLKQIRRQLEYGIAKGGLVIKPYIVKYDDKSTQTGENKLVYNKDVDTAEIEFDFIQADRFFPLAFDANGKVVEAAFLQTKLDKSKNRVFSRLEYHKLEGHTVLVQNSAYESTDMNLANLNNIRYATTLGNQIPLQSVPEWSSFQEVTTIENVDRLLFAYFKMPEANTIDPYSPLGVSGYSRVVQLIKDADKQYSRLLWEFEGGELAVDVDRDALKFITDPTSEYHSVLPETQQRLFRKVDLNSEDTYNVFSPQLRDASLISGLNTILTRIEDACGLSRGTLSEVSTQEAKTATELKILKQRSYATNADIQQALQDALEDVAYVMDVYCTLYDVTAPGEYEISFEWDDSIIIDSESELSKKLSLMQNGLMSRTEVRMWYFGETENQALAALQKVQEEANQAELEKAKVEAEAAGMMGEATGEADNKPLADTTSKKISKGIQADSLDNPDKSKTADDIKGTKI